MVAINFFLRFWPNVISSIKLVVLPLLLMLFSVNAFAASINVSVDRNPVAINDSFQLVFTTSTSADGDPDFSPLKQDFEVLNQQQNSQSSWINGKSSKTIQWTLTVMAKRIGRLTVPVINFGDDKSSPLTIIIEKATNHQNKQTQELFLEVEVSPKQAYVQAQILYTMRLYQRVQIAQASLTEPEISNAVIELLGDDRIYNTQIKGVNYRVTERSYALFPQQSGELTIPPLVLTAQIIIDDPNSRGNSFFNIPKTQTKRVISKSINLNVLPRPDSFDGKHWLPAKKLQLTQSWSNQDLQVNVGEPLTRTITMAASGVTASQLPELALHVQNSQLKIYPDQAEVNDQKRAEGIIAIRQQKAAFIPSTAGSYQLPAVEIPWFNTQTKQVELAVLPAVTITAIGQQQTADVPVTHNDIAFETTPAPSTQLQESSKENPVWKWISLALAIAWLLTLAYLYHLRFKLPQIQTVDHKPDLALKATIKAVNEACKNNNALDCQQAVMAWGKLQFNTANLATIKSCCNEALQQEITWLQQCLYAQEKSPWNGSKLLEAFNEQNNKNTLNGNEKETLEPLYRS